MDQGVAVGIFPAQNSTLLFIKKFLRFYHFLFVFVILLSNMSLPLHFFLVRKSLPLLYFSAKRSLHDFFFEEKVLAPSSSQPPLVPTSFASSLWGLPFFAERPWWIAPNHDQHRFKGLRYGLSFWNSWSFYSVLLQWEQITSHKIRHSKLSVVMLLVSKFVISTGYLLEKISAS